ncbi:MAG: LysR substrate-binding domain-containing protein [Bacillota bacterium]
MKERKIVFNKWVEIGSTEAIKSLVTANMGTGFVSKYSLSLEMSIGQLRILDIIECKIPLHYYVILAKDQHYYPAVLAFLNFIRKWTEGC